MKNSTKRAGLLSLVLLSTSLLTTSVSAGVHLLTDVAAPVQHSTAMGEALAYWDQLPAQSTPMPINSKAKQSLTRSVGSYQLVNGIACVKAMALEPIQILAAPKQTSWRKWFSDGISSVAQQAVTAAKGVSATAYQRFIDTALPAAGGFAKGAWHQINSDKTEYKTGILSVFNLSCNSQRAWSAAKWAYGKTQQLSSADYATMLVIQEDGSLVSKSQLTIKGFTKVAFGLTGAAAFGAASGTFAAAHYAAQAVEWIAVKSSQFYA